MASKVYQKWSPQIKDMIESERQKMEDFKKKNLE